MEQENREAINKTQRLIAETCDSLKELLLRKNKDYGDSAINPLRIFSSADPVEQINVRIDDKLSRIANKGLKAIGEDTELDLIGYLVLKRVAVEVGRFGDTLDQGQPEPEAEDDGPKDCFDALYALYDAWSKTWESLDGDSDMDEFNRCFKEWQYAEAKRVLKNTQLG